MPLTSLQMYFVYTGLVLNYIMILTKLVSLNEAL